ncbi:protein phosphatase 2C domain-containing protein [Streptomyces sp. NBC_01288]|uniref:protein phosphatase 2C domain-containing protein n=1 Tax=Streptomyces sp. NBC_01288 TaxID=2903814 RepID=UPI002E115E30|nr:protein phosphatase 2C domain-containing protein [Streptomyces sp. NBC_01288]
MDKRSLLKRFTGRPAEEPDAPEPTGPDAPAAPPPPSSPPDPRHAEAWQTAVPPGPVAPPARDAASAYEVATYRVPEYEVPAYDVPEYVGPGLDGPSATRLDGTRGAESAEQFSDVDREDTRDPRGGPPGQTGVPAERVSRPRHAAPQPGSRESGPGTPAPDSGRVANQWDRIVLGKPAAQVEPKPPPADPYRPDTVFDGWSTPHLTVRLASVRGDQHRFDGRPRQDDVVVAWHEPTATVVFAVADGVSSAAQSHVGAALACRTAVNDLLVQLGEDRQAPDWSRVLQAAAYQLLMRVARGREPDEQHRAEAIRTLATTLVAGTVAPDRSGGMHVTVVRAGDSSAWCLRRGQYAQLLSDGDTASEEIASTAVVALPRLSTRVRPVSYTLPSDSVLLVGTDGFGVPLGDGTGVVGELFGTGLAVPPQQPRALAHLLDFSRETFDDDRTLLAVWPRDRLSGGSR